MATNRFKCGLCCAALVVVLFIDFIIMHNSSMWDCLKKKSVSKAFKRNVTSGAKPEFSKWDLLQSNWIVYFPDLRDLIRKIPEHSSPNTSPEKTTVVLLNDYGDIRTGGVLRACITTRDNNGKAKSYGGDSFLAVLRPFNQLTDGVSCQVKDETNGNYTVQCILPFSGNADLEIIMLHPSESVYEMIKRYSSLHEYGVVIETEMKNSRSIIEITDCSIGFPDRTPEELCNFTNPTHGEQYMCLKPPSGECSSVIKQTMRPNMTKLKFWDDNFFVKGKNYKVPITKTKVTVIPSQKEVMTYKIDNTEWSLDPQEPSGWFIDGNWFSRKVVSKNYSVSRIERCFENKDVHFLGDSTVRQWYFHFRDKLRVKDVLRPAKFGGWSQPRDFSYQKANITMHFRPPGPTFHNNGDVWPFLSDVIDNVTGGEGTVILLTAGIHFELFSPDVFLDRIIRIRRAIVKLLQRLPGAKVIVKGLYHHDPRPPFVISPWKTRLLEILMRRTFQGIENLYYFETWDFMHVIGNTLVHPTDDVIEKNLKVLLSYVC